MTYEQHDDALDAIRQFDGANANGIIFKLTIPTYNLTDYRATNPIDSFTQWSRAKPFRYRCHA